MTDLHLSFHRSLTNPAVVSRVMVRRADGPWQPKIRFLISTFAFAIAAIPSLRAIEGPLLLAFWLLPCFAFVVVEDLVTQTLKRRLNARVKVSPKNQDRQINLTLNQTGLSDDMIRIPWAAITDTFQLKGITFLELTPIQAYPIPHAALTSGLTPDALAAQIAAWRAA